MRLSSLFVPVRVRDRLPRVCAAGDRRTSVCDCAGQSPIQSNRKSSSLAAQRGVSAFNFELGFIINHENERVDDLVSH